MGDIETFTMEEFDRLVAINVQRAVFAAIQRALPHLDATGRIIQHRQHQRATGCPAGLVDLCDDESRRRRPDARVGA